MEFFNSDFAQEDKEYQCKRCGHTTLYPEFINEQPYCGYCTDYIAVEYEEEEEEN